MSFPTTVPSLVSAACRSSSAALFFASISPISSRSLAVFAMRRSRWSSSVVARSFSAFTVDSRSGRSDNQAPSIRVVSRRTFIHSLAAFSPVSSGSASGAAPTIDASRTAGRRSQRIRGTRGTFISLGVGTDGALGVRFGEGGRTWPPVRGRPDRAVRKKPALSCSRLQDRKRRAVHSQWEPNGAARGAWQAGNVSKA